MLCADVVKMIVALVTLMMTPGALSADWSVTFENPNPCASKGSSVVFRCSYDYQRGQTVRKTAWFKGGFKDGNWKRIELSELPSYENRVEYLGDKQHNCTLAIYDLRDNDTGHYFFRFDTDMYGWRSRKSAYLSVTDLSAKVHPGVVRAGEMVTLKCHSTCPTQVPRWYKDGHPLTRPVPGFRAEAEDAGNYSCSTDEEQSNPVTLDVQYPPLNVWVEASHPGRLAKGSSVNLTCGSAANPAADSYTWYRRTAAPSSSSSSLLQVDSGQVLSLPSLDSSLTGLYRCSAANALGAKNSTELLLEIRVPDVSFILRAVVGVIAAAVVLVLLLIIVWLWRSRRTCAAEESNHDYVNLSVASVGHDTRVTRETTA